MRGKRAIVASIIVVAGAGAVFAAEKALYRTEDCSRMQVQMELNQCAGDNAEAADKALNVAYQKLLKESHDAKAQASLKQSERAWVAYRDKECASEVGPQEDGGSIWPMEMSNCLEDKTVARLRELNHRLDCPEGPLACTK